MSDDKEKLVSKAKDAAGAIAGVGAAAAQVLVVDSTWAKPELVAAMALAALFQPVVAAMTEASLRRLKARADRFYKSVVESWANDENLTVEEVAGRLEARRDDPDVADAVWRAVRGLMDAPNDAAAIPLGVLAADYARQGRKVDVFFRGTVRLLSELSAGEMVELRDLLVWVLRSTQREQVLILAYDKWMTEGERKQIPWRIIVKADEPEQARLVYDEHPTDGYRLLTLLTSNGLARDPRGSYYDTSPVEAEVERPAMERLVRLLPMT